MFNASGAIIPTVS